MRIFRYGNLSGYVTTRETIKFDLKLKYPTRFLCPSNICGNYTYQGVFHLYNIILPQKYLAYWTYE